MLLRSELSFIISIFSPQKQAVTLFKRNYLNRFDGMVLGILWVVVMPCLPIFIYNILQYMGVFALTENGVPRGVYLSLGIVVYYAFSESLSGGTDLHLSNRNEILRTGFSKPSLIQFSFLQVFADLAIRMLCLVVMFQVSGFPLSLKIIFIPVLAIPGILIGHAIGLLLGLLVPVYRDIRNMVQIAAFYLLFASGVFAVIPDTNLFFKILKLSPVYIAVNQSRWYLLQMPEFELSILLGLFAFAIFMFVFAMVIFSRAEKTVNSYL
ncbi:MAG: ABC transporter permease [Bacteroidetes bacterium]|nr:ABC transporter permease [Bacteroidota bacterium]